MRAQLVDVNMPLDNATGKHRGFGFVEYENPEDASEAIFNMNNGELNGRVLTVNLAKPMTVSERSQKAVWHAEADSYFDKEALFRLPGSAGEGRRAIGTKGYAENDEEVYCDCLDQCPAHEDPAAGGRLGDP